jgi:hypothetical protein
MRVRAALACIALAAAFAMPLAVCADTPPLVNGADATDYCSVANAFAYLDSLYGNVAPCALKPGSFVFEAIYLQNASRVGGTALADYPLVNVRAGLIKRLQFTFDAPSEVAQSRPGGGGAFPITHLGYGLTYTIAQSKRSATALITEVVPPDSSFAPTHTQARYLVGIASDVALTQKWTLNGTVEGTSSARYGFGQVLPTIDAGAAYAPTLHTQVEADLGERIVSRHALAQAFGNAAINQRLDTKLILTAGVGTTFNAVNDSKAHYLAAGFTYRP